MAIKEEEEVFVLFFPGEEEAGREMKPTCLKLFLFNGRAVQQVLNPFCLALILERVKVNLVV